MYFNAIMQFTLTTDCSIRQYQSVFKELSTQHAAITLQPIMLFVMLAYLIKDYQATSFYMWENKGSLKNQFTGLHFFIVDKLSMH